MCLSPVRISNPNFGNKTPLIQQTTDTISRYINVPCNVCSECVMARQAQIVQRAKVLCLDHYMFMCTLTYNRESLPVYTCSNGKKIPYADISDVQKMFKRIRYYNLFPRKCLYYFVSERGKENGRPHFHGLIFIPKFPTDDKLYPAQLETSLRKVIFSEWKRNYGSDRKPIWKPLFTYRTKNVGGVIYRNFDFHYCVNHSTEHGTDDVAFYVTKYILKLSDKERRLQQALRLNFDADEYENIWSVVRSRSFCSKGFGASTELEKSYIRNCLELTKDNLDGLRIFNSDGTGSPLPRYYRKFVSSDVAISSVTARGGPDAIRERSSLDKLNSFYRGNDILKKAQKRDISELFSID